MEAIQQDKEFSTQPGAHGQSVMANDVDESKEATRRTYKVGASLSSKVVYSDSHSHNSKLNERRESAIPTTSKPSGIAQLRQQSSANAQPAQHDHMNMDDFILPNSVASPANISRSPSVERNSGSTTAIASAIPIKKQNELRDQSFPHSLPLQAPVQSNMSGEFGYVQRHVRKTSIDERRVSTARSSSRPPSDQPLATKTTSRALPTSLSSRQCITT